ncbi:uroporphyrinogen decarboxylase family protein [Desulfomonile tiedjei]|uniref:Uroporphyrinogen decarboxylase (URO-D) n=1 Tax=Desulfomonile tiedjei (strain ATCC 49306 / DSM 6799 / DCB-1) TaxID=706587 RepID=I4C5F8_DESTA|nr:uroporphyrinogen decarboxylase family protein [Desulfomonile tiedjei]AFM24799.1 Uroporphyrinogen decarboxylase (URO-D) [Desulfomonile tiedjei DSM 6799]
MALTQKQRILDVVAGKVVDKLPFGARIDVWYNYHAAHGSLPEKYKDWKQTDIIEDQGAAAQKRFFSVCKEIYHDMEVVKRKEPPYEITEFRTPIGTCSISLLWSVNEGPWLAYEHEKLFKSEKDYPIIKYILEHTEPVYDDNYTKEYQEMGERGIVMTGTGLWGPSQRVMREIMGYELFYNEYMDRPEKVDELMEAMFALERKKLDIILKSDIEIINLCANWSDDIHTPVFRQYFTPWFRECNEKIHAAGKFSMAHADGEMRRLIPLYCETMLDIAEAITPVPQTQCELEEFRAMGDHVTLWGGIPSILFEPNFSDQEFDDYIKNMIKRIKPGTRFIMGMADNLPVAADIDRVGRVQRIIDEYGRLPIE